MLPAERRLIRQHRGRHDQLGFMVLLKFFQNEGRFPHHRNEIPTEVITYVAQQLDISIESYRQYDLEGRSIKRHRTQIRAFLKFREATPQDVQDWVTWLREKVVPQQRQMEALLTLVYAHCQTLHIEPPVREQLLRLIRSALATHDEQFCHDTLRKLTPERQHRLDELVTVGTQSEDESTSSRSPLQDLKLDPGRLSLETIQGEIAKLERLRACGLPDDLFRGVTSRVLDTYPQRAVAEEPYEIRRHPAALRYTILAAFCWTRQQESLDTLAELLIDTVHHLKTHAEKRVNQSFLADVRHVSGKNEILVKLSEAALAEPEGKVQQVLYPVVGEETLRPIVKEHAAGGLAYQQKLYAAIRGSYRAHYRQGLPAVLKVLTFHVNQKADSALPDALKRLQQYTATSSRQVHFADDKVAPLDNVIPEVWRQHHPPQPQ